MVDTGRRSIHPDFPGAPWWAAVLIAVAATTVGYALDAGLGHRELTSLFGGLYLTGCVTAVLAVQQSGLFTAIVQPPLILFCAVPGAYWLLRDGKAGTLKDLLINCGYPLIERFPLMLSTAAGVFLIGLIRWYFGLAYRPTASKDDTVVAGPRRSIVNNLKTLGTKLAWLFGLESDDENAEDVQPHSAPRRPQRAARPTRSSRAAKPAPRTRSRHPRPAPEDPSEPMRPHAQRRSSRATPHDSATEPRRRPRPAGDLDRRTQLPRDTRRDPRPNPPYERPTPRNSRFDTYGLFGAAESAEPRSRYDPYPPHEPRYRRTPPRPTSGARYREQTPHEEPRPQRRRRPRATDPWE